MSFRELLSRDFPLSPSQLDQLEQHYRLLQTWNRKMNLTRVEKLEDAVQFHYSDSLFVARALPQGSLEIADAGSGAGFPGVPIAVALPESRITLIESDKRKAVFLREATRGLPNVAVVAERAESISRRFDWVVSRAVRPDSVLALPIATHFALMISSSELDSLPKPISVLNLPSGNDRVLAMFHVEH